MALVVVIGVGMGKGLNWAAAVCIPLGRKARKAIYMLLGAKR